MTSRAATRQVSAASSRELMRSGFTAGVIVFMFLSFIIILVLLDAFLQSETGGASFLSSSIGIVPAMGFMALGFVGTAVPLVTYRDRGTLRLLGTTPLNRWSFLMGQIPVRGVIATIEIIIIVCLMAATGTHSPLRLLEALVTLVCGAAMFLAFGLLLGARGKNVDLTMQISLIAPIVVIATSGLALPLDIMPTWVEIISNALPTTWFMEALNSISSKADLDLALPLYWAGLLGIAGLAAAIAAAIFDWGGEQKR